MMSLDCWQTESATVFLRHRHISCVAIVDDTGHGGLVTLMSGSAIVVASVKAPHRSPPTGTPTGAFVVAGKGITTSKLATAFGTLVVFLARVQLSVALEVVKSSEP